MPRDVSLEKTRNIGIMAHIFLPACSYLERRGTITNSMRLVQWRQEGPDPLGDSKPDYWICNQLWRRIVELYKDSTDPKDEPIKFMTWNYSDDHTVEDILKEVNGYDLTTRFMPQPASVTASSRP